MATVELSVLGMTCKSCVRNIEETVGAREGIYSISVDLKLERAVATYDPTVLKGQDVAEFIDDMGFEAAVLSDSQQALANARPQSVSQREQTTISVIGMTCKSCVCNIEETVGVRPGVMDIVVSLEEEMARVIYVPHLTSAEEIAEAIDDMGFEASVLHTQTQAPPAQTSQDVSLLLDISPTHTESATIRVLGMTCGSCVRNIEETVGPQPGVVSIRVDLAREEAHVVFDPTRTSSRAVAEAIDDMGFEASVLSVAAPSTVHAPAMMDVDHTDAAHTRVNITPSGGAVSRHHSIGSILEEKPVWKSEHLAPSLSFDIDGNHVSGGGERVVLRVGGMTCSSCVANIERAVGKVAGVLSIHVGLLAEKAEVEYVAAMVSPGEIADKIRDIGFTAEVLREEETGVCEVSIGGMTCSSCVANIERNLAQQHGIHHVSVSLATHSGRISYDPALIGVRSIVEAIEDIGFTAELKTGHRLTFPDHSEEVNKWKWRFLACLCVFLPTVIMHQVLHRLQAPMMWLESQITPGLSRSNLIQLVFATFVQFIIGRYFYVSAYKSIKHKSPNMDALIVLGSSCAYAYSLSVLGIAMAMGGGMMHSPHTFFDTSVMLFTFVCLGRWLEKMATGKTSEALRELMSLRANEAILLRTDKNGDTSEKIIDADLVQRGDVVKVVPGSKVPVDGVIVFGHSSVDESMITGESVAIHKNTGDSVIGGTINQSGLLHVRATTVGGQSALAQIVKLVEEAQTSKAPIQRFADEVSAVFVPAIVTIAVATFFVWLALTCSGAAAVPEHESVLHYSLVFCISVLVVACPCALGLATPTAVMVGTGVGAKNGILIKGGGALEMAHRVTTVVFDKTGTLTHGHPNVAGVHVLVDEQVLPRCRVVELMGMAEGGSEHPYGVAIGSYAKAIMMVNSFRPAQATTVLPGRGIVAIIDGMRVVIGNSLCIAQEGIVTGSQADDVVAQVEAGHMTPILMAVDGRIVCVISLSDTIKPDAADAVRVLKRMGMNVLMISGDNVHTAQSVARQVGIDAENVYANVLPGNKSKVVRQLQEAGEVVAMVGEGINDSPALAQADLGMAIGSGTDVAIETADVVLIKSKLMDVVTAIDLSRTTVRRIRLNFFFACIYNVISIPIASGCFMWAGLQMHPNIAAGAMMFSSLSVVTSSLLLKLYRRPTPSWQPPVLAFKRHLTNLKTKVAVGSVAKPRYMRVAGSEDDLPNIEMNSVEVV